MNGKREWIALVYLVLAFGLFTASVTAVILKNSYSRRSFQVVGEVCEEIIEREPEMEQTVTSALKAYSLGHTVFLEDSRILAYGYEPADFFQSDMIHTEVLAVCGALTGGLLLLTAFFRRSKREEARIRELTDYVEQVNRGQGGILPRGREDAFSKLQDAICKTVTELHQTRDAAVKARDHFAENLSNIAHQIRTPITAMDLTVQLLEKHVESGQMTKRMGEQLVSEKTDRIMGERLVSEKTDRITGEQIVPEKTDQIMGESPVSELAVQIRRQLQCLTRLEEALLLLSRVDAGTLPMERKKVDMFTVLMLAADNLQELFDEAGVSVDIQEAGEAYILADLDWTMEAIMNLLKNCMEHTPSGGTVRGRYEQNPLYTEIRIEDTGSGFTKEDIPHLFERFYRGQNAKEGSIGIGLSLAKGIIESQNGTIRAGNSAGGGACFEIRFYSH